MTGTPDVAERLLELIADVMGVLELDELRHTLLRALRAAVPADWVSLNDLGADPASAFVVSDPPLPPAAVEVFARLAHENPLVARYARTRDGRAYRFSDVVSADALHATELYRSFYRDLGVEHQIAFTLPAGPERVVGIALTRRARDFSDAERDLLDRARPFLIQAYRNAVEHDALRTRSDARPTAGPPEPAGARSELRERGLTAREADVLIRSSTGRSAVAVAEALGISPRTVHKHLEHAYAKLGVRNRSDAAAVVWSIRGGRNPSEGYSAVPPA